MMDYNKYLNRSIQSVSPSGIRKFFDIANEMDDVISLSIGEPDFQTPWHIRDEGIHSLIKGKTWYSPNRGFADLLKEITRYYERRFNLTYSPTDQTLVTVGGSEAIDLAFRTLVESGDEVIIPQPSFVCYEPLAVMAGGTPVIINTKNEDNFRLKADDLRAAITPKTKLLVLPFPNNPTGAIMERHDLEEIAKVVIENDLIVLSDEIYSELTYGGRNHVSIASVDGMYERTVVINGFSKSYAMTGWRIGYALGAPEIISAMTKIHQYTMLCAPVTAQIAAIEALRRGEKYMKKMAAEYDRRRGFIYRGLTEIGLQCFEPKGAFYIFPDIRVTGLSSEQFAEDLLRTEHVALVPGSAFGECGEGYVRCSYATSLDKIDEALARIGNFLAQHTDFHA